MKGSTALRGSCHDSVVTEGVRKAKSEMEETPSVSFAASSPAERWSLWLVR